MRVGTRVKVVAYTELVRFIGTVRSEDGEIVYVHNLKADEVVGVPRVFVRTLNGGRR